ncbi:hypothetical protein ACFPT7_14485 [Acidicapsa dinghuensis]|uniref:Uncharacterized protein n=1 Tax=Acidicapsa dinghuensis TaxID=2218256 RepID=A0ABW1EH70_9BACT|nr:hypothetical protein [Acidicapsa dinghuensis]
MKKLLYPILAAALVLTGSSIARSQDQGQPSQPQPAGAEPQAQSSPDAAKPDVRINGKWHFVFDTEGGDREFEAEFTVDPDGNVTGTFGPSAVKGTFKDGHLSLLFETTSEEANETAPLHIDGKFDDKTTSLTGTWQFSSYDGAFKATHPDTAQPTQ